MTVKKSKTILVTGATGGMGSACALLGAQRGYNLVLLDLDNTKLENLARECAGYGINANYHAVDIGDSAAISNFVSEFNSGPDLDAVIHTVGLSPNMATWKKIIRVDLVGTVELLEKLKKKISPGGCAVCIASMSAHMIPPNAEIDSALADPLATDLIERLESLPGSPLSNPGFAYAYAKKALIAFVNNHAMDWGREGKRLVSISPGLIDTDMGRLEAEADKDSYAAMRSLIALKRDGEAREIATAALFLASDDASYISGCDLLVDGGFVASFRKAQAQT